MRAWEGCLIRLGVRLASPWQAAVHHCLAAVLYCPAQSRVHQSPSGGQGWWREGSGMQTACNTSMFVECLGKLFPVGWAHRLQCDWVQCQLCLWQTHQFSPMYRKGEGSITFL